MKQPLSAYKNLYIETAKVYLTNLSKDLNALTRNHADKYAIQDSYICAHSLKSQSAVMGFSEMEALCQVIERLFHDIHIGNLVLTDELLTLLKHALHGLQRSIIRIEMENTEDNLTKHREDLQKVSNYEESSHH